MPAPNGSLHRPPRILLTFDYAGRTWRIASAPLDIQDRRGRHLRYSGGLPPLDVYEEAPLFDSGKPLSFGMELAVPPDLAAMLAEHHEPAAGVGELALYRDDDPWEARYQVVAGQVRIQALGGRGEPVSMTLTGYDPARSVASHPPTTARMDNETWGYDPAAAPGYGYRNGQTLPIHGATSDMDEGKPYPWVFGSPGRIVAGGAAADVPVVPCYPVVVPDTFDPATGESLGFAGRMGLIAGHPCPWQVFTMFCSDGTRADQDLYWAYDRLGRIVSVARAHWGWGVDVRTTFTYRGAINDGALQQWHGGPAIRDAGTLLRWAFSLMGDTEVDWRKVAPSMAGLKGWKLAGYWDGVMPPWQWLTREIAPLLPVSLVPGPRGVYPVLWRPWVAPSAAVAHIEDGRTACFEGAIEEEGCDDVATSQVLQFAEALLPNQRYFHRNRWRGANWQRVGDSRSLHLRRARLEYVEALRPRLPNVGARINTTETSSIYDYPTADLACGLQALLHSGPVHVVKAIGYGVNRGMDHLTPGDPVLLTSSRLSLSRTLAHVVRAGWTEGGAPYVHAAILPGSRR